MLRHGRVLATRRTRPPSAAGRWELPGGKVEPGEEPAAALVREVREELGCRVRVTGTLAGEQPVGDGLALRVLLAELVGGEPVPHEHDALRWLGPEELEEVPWLGPDRPFLAELREHLLDGHRLGRGNGGGAVRIGPTVRRPTGPWTPSVHRLLRQVRARGLRAVPDVLGVDSRGREVLTYLEGAVADADTNDLTDARLADVGAWTRELHSAARGLQDTGPWRSTGVAAPTVLGHNDLAPCHLRFSGERLSGVLGWDLAGPSTPLLELAHLAWNGVPLCRPGAVADAARRLRVIADAYGGVGARAVLHAVPDRERSERALPALLARIPDIERALSSRSLG